MKKWLHGILNFIQVNVGFGFDVKAKEALNYFKSKGLKESFSYVDVFREEHASAFTVAKMMDMDLLKDVQDSLHAALAEGLSFDSWKERIVPALQANGWWGRQAVYDPISGKTIVSELGSPHRLEVIFRTNMQMSYSVGQWQQIMAQSEEAPYLMYDAVDDYRTRPQHWAWNKTILRFDNPWWRTHYPPNGWLCRCGVIQLSDGDLEVMGLSVSDNPRITYSNWQNPRTGINQKIPEGIDPGFDYNPGILRYNELQKVAKEKAAALPDNLRAAAEQSLKDTTKAAKKPSPAELELLDSPDSSINKNFNQPPSETFSIYDDGAPTVKPDISTPRKTAVVEYEDGIRDKDVEHGAFFGDGENSLILDGKGDTNMLAFDLTQNQLNNLKDSTFTHNHPKGGTFSVDDIVSACDMELREIRAVTGKMRHSMAFNARWINKNELRRAIDEAIPKANDTVTAMLLSDEINISNANNEVSHQVWRLIAQRFGFTYTREKS